MVLDKSDLKSIKQIVDEAVDSRVAKSEAYLKDYIEFAIEKSEVRTGARFDKLEGEIKDIKSEIKDIKSEIKDINSSIDGLIETNNHFLGFFDSHEKRITRVEVKTGIKPA